MGSQRPSTSHSTSNSTYAYEYTTPTSRFAVSRQTESRAGSRPATRTRSRTAGSTIGGSEYQQIICAVSESRGVSPSVGLAFVNISTGEAVLSQICDNQFYVRTCHKLQVFECTEILLVSTAGPPNQKSKMYSCIEETVIGTKIVLLNRRYWSESAGLDYIHQLAFPEDIEAIKIAVGGNYYAVCCLAAALKYLDHEKSTAFAFHSLRIKFQPSEGSMMIDLSTIRSLELIQNIQNPRSRDCLFGLMNETITPMGTRLLRANILQPSTEAENINLRFDAVEELNQKEEMFFDTKKALKSFLDIDQLLTNLIIVPTKPDIQYAQRCINNVLILKNFVLSINHVFEALSGALSTLLMQIRDLCRPERVQATILMINARINEDVSYQNTPVDLRNQRMYAVKSGVNGFLDVARQTFKEATEDVHQHVNDINQEYEIRVEIRYEPSRKYYLRIPESNFEDRRLPDILINPWRKKGYIECQTLDLVKLNQRLEDAHQEVIIMTDKTVQILLEDIRGEIPSLFKVSESVGLLDMLTSFAHIVTLREYCRPEITDCFAIKSGRHPVHEKAHSERFIPNDVYATQQSRFQIITGCNMSGKSTYIRSIALMSVMAQIGSFVPAHFASFPIIHQLFARVSVDDCIEANVSTFASEMRETAFILRNIDKRSLAIIDELGRGTSTRDGLAIALSIAEALVNSKAFVWFATHFRDLAQIMSERSGVTNLHLSVETTLANSMKMMYKIAEGYVKDQHYGLALARMAGLPPKLLEIAEEVSTRLEKQAAAKKQSSKALGIARGRKLVLKLRETLLQTRDGPMEGAVLLSWLRRLQGDFVKNMFQIENDASSSGVEDEENNVEDVIVNQMLDVESET